MSKTSCLILQGKESFSISKLDQLNHAFNKTNALDVSLSSFEIYLVASSSDLTDQLENISQILKSSNDLYKFSFIVGPRAGTITPWSSKTEDIFKNVGIKGVERVERFFGSEEVNETVIEEAVTNVRSVSYRNVLRIEGSIVIFLISFVLFPMVERLDLTMKLPYLYQYLQ